MPTSTSTAAFVFGVILLLLSVLSLYPLLPIERRHGSNSDILALARPSFAIFAALPDTVQKLADDACKSVLNQSKASECTVICNCTGMHGALEIFMSEDGTVVESVHIGCNFSEMVVWMIMVGIANFALSISTICTNLATLICLKRAHFRRLKVLVTAQTLQVGLSALALILYTVFSLDITRLVLASSIEVESIDAPESTCVSLDATRASGITIAWCCWVVYSLLQVCMVYFVWRTRRRMKEKHTRTIEYEMKEDFRDLNDGSSAPESEESHLDAADFGEQQLRSSDMFATDTYSNWDNVEIYSPSEAGAYVNNECSATVTSHPTGEGNDRLTMHQIGASSDSGAMHQIGESTPVVDEMMTPIGESIHPAKQSPGSTALERARMANSKNRSPALRTLSSTTIRIISDSTNSAE